VTIWYVHRRGDNSIASAHSEPQPGYAEEALDDTVDAEMMAYIGRATARPSDDYGGLIERRARAAERRGDDVAAIKLRMGIR
jgi:hypothetical protein